MNPAAGPIDLKSSTFSARTMLAAWIRLTSRHLAAKLTDGSGRRRCADTSAFVAAEVHVLEERALLSAVSYSIATEMGWSATTAPTYATNLPYSSAGTWEGLNIINYSPSHYADFNSNGQLTTSDGVVLGDTMFQDNLAAASNFLYTHPKYGTFVNYIQGNPQLTIYNDLAQLQLAGFDGVRLYADGPQVEIATILAAQQLSTDTGHQFYVELEVYVPDLSQSQYYGGTVADRINTLYTQETAATPAGQAGLVEGGLQQLHYVINIVGAEAFSQTVPLVFFGHEDLVQPTSDIGQPLTDDNSSVPLLQWGINATRAILAKDLAGYSFPSVTTALVAGQVVDVSVANNAEIAKLIDTIQTDMNSPIAYDVYAFQWANTYFTTTAYPYVNNSDVIANAYPAGAEYYDRVPATWTSGSPPVGVSQNYTPTEAVTRADLMWSLQWMADRVNWIWGTPQGTGGVAKQLVAETGWAGAQAYTQTQANLQPGIEVTGTAADAKAYFAAVKAANFNIGGAPIMYFEAYDEPVKEETTSSMYSENHYGIYTWTGLPKFDTSLLPANAVTPFLTQPFAVVTIAPTNLQTNSVAQLDSGKSATDTAYTLQVANGATVRPGSSINVPFFWGTGGYSDGNPIVGSSSVTWMPNAMVILRDGDIVTLTSTDPGTTLAASIQLQFDITSTNTIYTAVTDLTNGSGETLTPPSNQDSIAYSSTGSPWALYLSFPWLHGGSNSYGDTTTFPPVYQDFWGSGAQMVGPNLMVSGTEGDDTIRILLANASNTVFAGPPWDRRSNPKTATYEILVNGVSTGTFGPVSGAIVIQGFNGNDKLIVDRSVRTPTIIDGGPGDDLLVGGRGKDKLIGGSGRDIMKGNGGHDKKIDDRNHRPLVPLTSNWHFGQSFGSHGNGH